MENSPECKLINIKRDPLFGLGRQEFERSLAHKLKGRVLDAYFFGSYARGELNKFSDIDLILIKDTSELFTKRPLEFEDLLDLNPGLEILVYNQIEFDNLINNPTIGFWTDVKRDLLKLQISDN